jgi:predicted peptidase
MDPAIRLLFCLSVIFPGILSAQQTARYTYHVTDYPIGYLEYLPPNYDTGPEKFPLLIFLHGGSESGNGTQESLERVKAWGPPALIENGHDMCFTVNGEEQCFIVLSPQLYPNIYTWPYTVWQLMDHVLNGPIDYKIDPDRIYLTGLSRGGLGVYQYTASVFNNSNKLAAIAPIAAWSEDGDEGCRISARKIPVWAFHGELDTVIPYGWGRAAFNSIKYCNNPSPVSEMIFTAYSDRYHDSWIPAYDTTHLYNTPNLFEWLLMQKRPEVVTSIHEATVDEISSIYPNPAQDQISLSIGKSFTPSVVQIWSLTGELKMSVKNTALINISALPGGVYFLRARTDTGLRTTKRFVKIK